MTFKAQVQVPRTPTRWETVTHVRLIDGVRPDMPFARERWQALAKVADRDGLIPIAKVYEVLRPVRNGYGHVGGIRRDLRVWSNPRTHGNNSQDKGWLEIGSMV